MLRLSTILAASLSLVGVAQAQSPQYHAIPATASTKASVIADGVMWRCGSEGCVATNATSRPAIVCAQAVRQVGKLTSFSVGTAAFDADALAKCNAKAKA